MGDKPITAYTEWQAADTAAREAERRLESACLAHQMGGAVPLKEMAEEVARLRAVADQKLKEAIHALAKSKL